MPLKRWEWDEETGGLIIRDSEDSVFLLESEATELLLFLKASCDKDGAFLDRAARCAVEP